MRIELELDGLVGVYSRADDRVVLVVFTARSREEAQTSEEAAEVRAFAPPELPWKELAFWSTREALRDCLDQRGLGPAGGDVASQALGGVGLPPA